jgi:hypothetical protein
MNVNLRFVCVDEPVSMLESSRRADQVSSSQPRDVSHSKEFDPYSSQKSVEENNSSKVMSAFGMSGKIYVFIKLI